MDRIEAGVDLNHGDRRLRVLERDGLRVLYRESIYYDPSAPPWRRAEKQRSWAGIVSAAE